MDKILFYIKHFFTNKKPIYLIHTMVDFKLDELNPGCYVPTSLRTPVYCHVLEDAKEFVENNYCDIFECCYRYVLIEEVHPFAYDCPIKRWWYEWDEYKEGYVPIHQPYKMYDDEMPMSLVIG